MPNAILGDNLIDDLVPILDEVRDLVAEIVGDHQFRVFLVVRTWTTPRRGDGPAVEVETEILPIPVVDFGSRYSHQAGGRQEDGSCKVTQVSLTYTEAELDPPSATTREVFYRLKDAQGQAMKNRDYVLDGSPVADRTQDIGWVLNLKQKQR